MPEISISFLSSRGAGLNSDMKLVQEKIALEFPNGEYSFRYFLRKEMTENPMVRQGLIDAKKEFCQSIENAICTDTSLNVACREGQYNRVLLAVAYDYQFKSALRVKNNDIKNKLKTFRHFTHIITGSPFVDGLLKDAYNMEGITAIQGVPTPFIWELNQPTNQEQMRKSLEFYFPQMKGKKVFAIILYDDNKQRKNFVSKVDIKALIKKLGDDWFVLTNQEEIMEDASHLDMKYHDRFGYVSRILPGQDVLYVADALVTNYGRFASSFASRKKPLFCAKMKENYFEKYMEQCFGTMYLEKWSDLLELDFQHSAMLQQQDEFQRLFCYEELKSPYQTVIDLMRNK